MAKVDWAAIDTNSIVQGIYEFKDKEEEEVQAHFPGQIIIDVTDEDPMPGPGWIYTGTGFTPEPYVPPLFSPYQAAVDLIATIDFTKLDDDQGKALTAILYLVGGLNEEV